FVGADYRRQALRIRLLLPDEPQIRNRTSAGQPARPIEPVSSLADGHAIYICHPTLDTGLSAVALGPYALHFSNHGGIDDETAEGRDRRHVESGEPMYGPHEDAKVGQVPVRRWPDRERQEGMHRRVAQLTQLLVLKPVEEAEASVCCSGRD